MTSSARKSEGMLIVMVVRPDPSVPLPALDEDWPDASFTPSGGAKWIGIASIPPSAFRLASSGGESGITYVDLVRLPPAPPVAAAAFLLAARAACSIKEVLFDAEPAKIRKTQVKVARLKTQRKGKAHVLKFLPSISSSSTTRTSGSTSTSAPPLDVLNVRSVTLYCKKCSIASVVSSKEKTTAAKQKRAISREKQVK